MTSTTTQRQQQNQQKTNTNSGPPLYNAALLNKQLDKHIESSGGVKQMSGTDAVLVEAGIEIVNADVDI